MEHIRIILASKLVSTALLDRSVPLFHQHLLIVQLELTVDLEQQNVCLAQVDICELIELCVELENVLVTRITKSCVRVICSAWSRLSHYKDIFKIFTVTSTLP